MKKMLVVLMFVLAVAGFMMAQTWSSPVDVLGAHQNGGRGCAGCHAPHSGSFGSGHGGAADAGSYALWGQDASPLYGKSIAMGDGGKFVEVLPTGISSASEEVGGILLCLSCHDGNLTPSNMMQNWSYEQQIGLLSNTTYGGGKIPTLLGNDGTGAGNYTNDHPVGLNATLTSYGNPMQGKTSGIVYANGVFTVQSGSQYAQFVANYGWPALAPGKWGTPYGVAANGTPFVLCTTCHNQHVMTVYPAGDGIPGSQGGRGGSPIAGQTTGYYATFFFINGPYNPNLQGKLQGGQAASTTQFCRQCHFGEANEANNTNNIPTVFQ
jgi:hypothetical protein